MGCRADLTSLRLCSLGIKWHWLAYGLPHFCPIPQARFPVAPGKPNDGQYKVAWSTSIGWFGWFSWKSRPVLTAHVLTAENAFFARRYAKSEPGNPLLKVKISISSAYFSALETMADFFNRIGQKRTLTSSLPFYPVLPFTFVSSLRGSLRTGSNSAMDVCDLWYRGWPMAALSSSFPLVSEESLSTVLLLVSKTPVRT